MRQHYLRHWERRTSVPVKTAVASMATVLVCIASLAAQSPRLAPADAPSRGQLAPAREPGTRLTVNGIVVDAAGAPVAAASIYAYQTDAEGYYGVKPESDNQRPRLKLFLRSDASGAWSFETIRPGSYPASRAPGHIHFEVSAAGFAPKVFEIVFEGDPFITADMRRNPAFSVQPIDARGRVTQRIVLVR